MRRRRQTMRTREPRRESAASRLTLLSFPRKRESRLSKLIGAEVLWIPAYAGMTGTFSVN
jgi:hypothetical protein